MEWITKLPEPILWGAIAIIAVVVWGIMNGKIKFKKNKDGSFQLGDNTEFEKTNTRFKQLCHDIHEVHEQIPLMQKKIDDFGAKNDEMQMYMLRNTIASEQLPDDERINAYDDYKKRGGNSWVDMYFKDQIDGMKARMKERLAGIK
jgi:hypothetical protein